MCKFTRPALHRGAVCSAGFWIVGGKRKVSSIIHQCATWRWLRAPLRKKWGEKMASLPAACISTDPPFTNVGLDVHIRPEKAIHTAKWWAMIFSSMSLRAVHIEVIDSLETSCFIHRLRYFLAVHTVSHIHIFIQTMAPILLLVVSIWRHLQTLITQQWRLTWHTKVAHGPLILCLVSFW